MTESLIDNLLDSLDATLGVNIPRQPTTAKIPIKKVKGYSLAGIVINNATRATLSINGHMINLAKVGGSLWMASKSAIPIDELYISDVELLTDGCSKESLYIPRTQELEAGKKYLAMLLAPTAVGNAIEIKIGDKQCVSIISVEDTTAVADAIPTPADDNEETPKSILDMQYGYKHGDDPWLDKYIKSPQQFDISPPLQISKDALCERLTTRHPFGDAKRREGKMEQGDEWKNIKTKN